MEVINPQAAGVDVGSRSHWVAVGQSEQDVREYGVFNEDLFSMADWLKEKGIKTVAMESTGTYWQNNTMFLCVYYGLGVQFTFTFKKYTSSFNPSTLASALIVYRKSKK